MEKISVTFTLIPASTARIAGNPSGVAGILIIEIRPVYRLEEALRRGDRAVGVVREIGLTSRLT